MTSRTERGRFRGGALRSSTVQQRELRRMLRNWKDERESAALYEALASIERNPRLSRVFSKLASSELEHAAFWEELLRTRLPSMPVFRVSLRTRILAKLARRFGVAFVIPSITARELADRNRYSGQDDAAAAGLAKEELGHAAVMRAVGNHAPVPGEGPSGSALGRAASLANNLRAAVLGANDGLASNFCLLMGVAGGGAPTSMILLAGVAGLSAGACAMALGEWLSVTNAREMAGSQIDKQIEESGATHFGERKDLALIYEAKGMSEDQAKSAAERLMTQDAADIDALAQEDLEIEPAHLGANAGSAAAFSFALFALGAIVPLAPFFFLSARSGIIASIGLSLAALFVLGLVTSFFNGRSPLFSGLRQLGVGAAAAAITYVVGRVFGAVIT